MLAASTDIDGRAIASHDQGLTAVIVFASWCQPCRNEIALLGEIATDHPQLRVIGVNAYEEFADRSDEEKLRAFVAVSAPWMQVVIATDALMDALGKPKKVPTLFVFDSAGQLVASYLRARRAPPTKAELLDVLTQL